MNAVLIRLIIVYVILHIILFFVEWFRYSHSNWSWYGFKHEGMLTITCLVLVIDTFLVAGGIIGAVAYWILQPAM